MLEMRNLETWMKPAKNVAVTFATATFVVIRKESFVVGSAFDVDAHASGGTLNHANSLIDTSCV